MSSTAAPRQAVSRAPLAEICDITMGQSPPSSTYNTTGDGLPFFQGATDLGDVYPKARVYCSDPARIAEKGDILISVRAPVGPTNRAPARSCIGRGVAALRPHPELDVQYLLYFLRHQEARLAYLGKGSTFDAIGRDDLEEYPIPLLPLPVQRRIAGILDKADRLRRMRRYALELSDQFLPALFLRMFGDPASNPKGWEKVPLGGVVAVNPASDREFGPDELVSFVAMADVDEVAGEIARADDRPYRQVAVGYTPFMDGDVLFAKITPCMENGKAAVASLLTGGHGFGSTEFHVLRVGPEVRREWLFSYVRLPWFRRLAKASFTGTAGQQRVPDGFLRHHDLYLPPAGLQDEYVRSFGQHAQTRAFHREALRQAEHLFQSLLNQYFGKEN